ncbi:hypothetical protein C2845_PM07G39550 [Panicum miliaceum]|uniref:Uncharacterized protein n=1 Tax=Panicum miliaceum TaxID=4540 RepID=A0A3L6SMT1_PANMI|nr:hypothetical protein C2845_PM07G39550 [Panicum miliaceum]
MSLTILCIGTADTDVTPLANSQLLLEQRALDVLRRSQDWPRSRLLKSSYLKAS